MTPALSRCRTANLHPDGARRDLNGGATSEPRRYTTEDERDPIRPITRGECSSIPRPCPFASCRYSLLAEITASGRVVDVFGDRDVEPGFSCALDVADTGGVTLERIGEQAGFTRERIRQLEHVALRKFLVRGGSALLEELGLRRTR